MKYKKNIEIESWTSPVGSIEESATTPGSVLTDMAGTWPPNTDPILPKQQGPMNLAEGG